MKPERNALCRCGSGKKYKHCCLGKAEFRPAEPASVEYDQLVSLSSAGRHAELENKALSLIGRYPNCSFAWKLLGESLYMQGKDSLSALRKTTELLPDDADAFNNLSIVLTGLGQFNDAVNSCRRALKIKPNDARAYNNLGNALNELGHLNDAAVSFRRALEIKPDYAKAHNNLGGTLLMLNQTNDAAVSFRRALKFKPDYAEAHNNLGITLLKLNQTNDAAASYQRAVEIKPDYTEAHFNFGNTLKTQGKLEAAAACFRSCLEIDPKDRLGARLLLAALGFEPMPLRASEAHLEAFYNKKAIQWDKNLGRTQTYFGAELVAQALKSQSNKSEKLDILDAGCGTGHVGLLIRDLANRLDGVDITPSMLEKAREKIIYDNIYPSDLESFMKNNPNQYDAITCAATLIHFGDLSPVFSAAATCLRDDGLFVFTVFQNDSEQDEKGVVVSQLDGLAQSGCYAHSRNYVTRLAESAGFVVEMLNTEIHEIHEQRAGNSIPIMCFVVVLHRHPR